MPRLIPRIRHANPQHQVQPLVLPKRKWCLHRPVPPIPSFNVKHYPQSILLQPQNPVMHSYDYFRHKTLPPPLARLTALERDQWANPYLRMLASPIRRDNLTRIYLPSDFLIRFAVVAPSTRTSDRRNVVIPDGLEHPRFKTRRVGRATMHALCWNRALEQIDMRGALFKSSRGQNIRAHSHLIPQISHLLRLRILQEIDMLARRLETQSKDIAPSTPILRRLTRQEFNEMRTTGLLPHPDALAVLVVPPLNKDPITKERPVGSMSAKPGNSPITIPTRPSHPPFLLYSASKPVERPLNDVEAIASAQIPLYNCVTLFPDREQRASLHSLLLRVLAVERKAKYCHSPDNHHPGDQKPSHAFLLSADSETILRADAVPIAIALWRLRMFEGDEWDGRSLWMKRLEHRSLGLFEE